MKFLKINAKVLLILCLFSGILFLSTGCDDKDKTDDKKDSSEVDKNNTSSDTTATDNKNDSTDPKEDKDAVASTTESKSSDTTDYSVWVANTTINTDKNQRSYKVIWGDTLWLISTAWDVSYQEIARYNNIKNPDLIYVDQIIYNPLFK